MYGKRLVCWPSDRKDKVDKDTLAASIPVLQYRYCNVTALSLEKHVTDRWTESRAPSADRLGD